MALLTLQDASDGLDEVTFAAAEAGGDQIPQGTRAGNWDLGVVLLVNNDDASTHDVTVANVDGSAGTAITVPVGGLAVIPVRGIYRGAARNVTYDGVTSVTVAAVRIARS